MIARAEDSEKRNRQLHVDLTTAQARIAALESREVIAVEALKQAKDEHVQKLMEAYLVTHNQRRALRIQEPAPSNPVEPIKAEDPQILEGHPVSIRGEKKAWELPKGAIVLEGIPVFPQAMDKQEHPESLKGKCAFGPFLSILVIECKHKCLKVKICPRMIKVQITS
jgi:hypothetical protein